MLEMIDNGENMKGFSVEDKDKAIDFLKG